MVAVITGIVCGETPRPSGARAAFKDAGQAERHLLAALGMKRRPVVDKSKVEIPTAMLELYRMQMSNEYDTAGLPLPGRHVKSANTARTYLHRGEFRVQIYFIFIFFFQSTPHHSPPSHSTRISTSMRNRSIAGGKKYSYLLKTNIENLFCFLNVKKLLVKLGEKLKKYFF